MLEPDTYDVWTWTPGKRWTRALEAGSLDETTSLLVWLKPMQSGAAFSTVLSFDPNHATADDVAEMAEMVCGPIPDTAHRRHAA